MSRNCCRWSTLSRRFAAHAADRSANPRSSTPTVATILMRIAADFASEASDRSSPGAAPNTAAASANSVGSSNGLTRGSMVSVVFAFASNVDLTFTKHSSNWPARSSAGTSSAELSGLFELASKRPSVDDSRGRCRFSLCRRFAALLFTADRRHSARCSLPFSDGADDSHPRSKNCFFESSVVQPARRKMAHH